MSTRLIKIAALYLLLGVTLGIGMGMTQQFALAPVHAHVNLLGWASLAIIGVVYRVYPNAAETRLARVHFWGHNLGLPVFMLGLALIFSGHAEFHPMVNVGATVVFLSLVAFVVNLWRVLRPAASDGGAAVAGMAAMGMAGGQAATAKVAAR
jgi:cbb3-type cytochrome oxidase subunit 1